MNNFIEFLMLDPGPGMEYTITVPSDMSAGDLAALLMPHMSRCIVSDISVKDVPQEDHMDECMDIVFNTTGPGDDITEKDAERIINDLKNDGWDIPDMLTPSLFVELYNDLEPEEEDEE